MLQAPTVGTPAVDAPVQASCAPTRPRRKTARRTFKMLQKKLAEPMRETVDSGDVVVQSQTSVPDGSASTSANPSTSAAGPSPAARSSGSVSTEAQAGSSSGDEVIVHGSQLFRNSSIPHLEARGGVLGLAVGSSVQSRQVGMLINFVCFSLQFLPWVHVIARWSMHIVEVDIPALCSCGMHGSRLSAAFGATQVPCNKSSNTMPLHRPALDEQRLIVARCCSCRMRLYDFEGAP